MIYKNDEDIISLKILLFLSSFLCIIFLFMSVSQINGIYLLSRIYILITLLIWFIHAYLQAITELANKDIVRFIISDKKSILLFLPLIIIYFYNTHINLAHISS
jgi:hypothetical protein